MILILSENFDASTNKVIDWIRFFGSKAIRINETDLFDSVTIEMFDNEKEIEFCLYSKDNQILLSEIKSFWYRRGSFKLNLPQKLTTINEPDYIKWYEREIYFLKESLYDILCKKHHIGDIRDNRINKIDVLLLARAFGLEIPKTIITNEKIQLKKFLKKCSNRAISKSIKDNLHSQINESCYVMQYTKLVDNNVFDELPNTFGYTLFQECIEKKFELRIFYLDNEFYSMAIFSQNNPKTEIDFRKYDTEKPNRTIPFKLPTEIEDKLRQLMNSLNLISGSIDMIVNDKNKYFFLEVNPVGQFGQVSLPCNYHLEEKIAKYLCKNAE